MSFSPLADDSFLCSSCLHATGIKKLLQKWKSEHLPQGCETEGKALEGKLQPSDVSEHDLRAFLGKGKGQEHQGGLTVSLHLPLPGNVSEQD